MRSMSEMIDTWHKLPYHEQVSVKRKFGILHEDDIQLIEYLRLGNRILDFGAVVEARWELRHS